ncbi:hypothetical protein, variant 1 [Aphanomyces invadans]|uniref:RGS domain-containing protein n=1 Tax=Aphanomyces invadans TaxID=157072 RepID=A0A024TTF9_9STRA|nr:hypothetical protein, variant 1 [Aphanomyces invadans]ETV97309.1 hypothetical protein, variant 1 [Aphanomyces invadans]|eukprot:XP_008874018.1 hypothetical protein, variant 1 [Aphanomyces invadans]
MSYDIDSAMASCALIVCWASGAYMPVALAFYVKHRNHPSIKYRQPMLMAVVGLLCTIQCWGMACIGLFGRPWSCVAAVVPSLVLFRVTGLVYFLAQGSVVAMFSITELLALPQHRSPTALKRMQAYRWLLFRPVQAGFVMVGGILALGVGIGILPSTLWHATFGDCVGDRPVQALYISTAAEIAAMSAVSLYLSRHISMVVDNFGLRQTYERAALAMFVVAVVGAATMASAAMGTKTAEVFRTAIHAIAAHVVVGFHIVLPVRRRHGNSKWVTRTLAIRPMSSTASHWQKATLLSVGNDGAAPPPTTLPPPQQTLPKGTTYTKLSRVCPATLSHSPSYETLRRLPPAKDIHALLVDLQLFLGTPDGFDAVLAYAHKESHTQELLAWAMVEKFKRRLVTAQTVYDHCLAPQSLLWCKAAAEVAPAVARILHTPPPLHLHRVRDTSPHSPSMRRALDEFSTKLVKVIYFKVLPGFQQHSAAWHEFLTTLKTMDLLESVDKMTQQTTSNTLSKVSKAEPLPILRKNSAGGLHDQSEWSQYANTTSIAAPNHPSGTHCKSEVSQTITR